MSKPRITTHGDKGRSALTLLGLALALGGVAVAIAADGWRQGGKAKQSGAPAPFSIRIVAPKTRSVAPAGTTRFALRIRRRVPVLSLVGRRKRRPKVRLSAVGPLPGGIRISFKPRWTKRKSRMTVTALGARSGSHRIRIRARRGRRRATAAVTLIVTAPRRADFTIAGDLSGQLAPGLTRPLNLVLTNPGDSEIAVTELQVAIKEIELAVTDPSLPCTAEDFSVAQFSGELGFTLAPSSTASLGALGFPQQDWPQVTMLNRAVNQDGCKEASLRFAYSGTATGEDQ